MGRVLKGRPVIPGRARGEVLKTGQPLSFWGGVDFRTGLVVDPGHELHQVPLAGKVLVFPLAKGSSGAGLVILELVRSGLAPAAMINLRSELVLAAGPLLARHFYGHELPVVTLEEEEFGLLETGQRVAVDGGAGEVVLEDPE